MFDDQSASDIIRILDMKPHPEGGYYRETFRDSDGDERGYSTAIYYLLKAEDCSAWHRVNDAVEIWHYYAGAALDLTLSKDGHTVEAFRLGADVIRGETPQVIVPRRCWQSAKSSGSWTLAGCTVAPGFEFSGFEMAPTGWQPTYEAVGSNK